VIPETWRVSRMPGVFRRSAALQQDTGWETRRKRTDRRPLMISLVEGGLRRKDIERADQAFRAFPSPYARSAGPQAEMRGRAGIVEDLESGGPSAA